MNFHHITSEELAATLARCRTLLVSDACGLRASVVEGYVYRPTPDDDGEFGTDAIIVQGVTDGALVFVDSRDMLHLWKKLGKPARSAPAGIHDFMRLVLVDGRQ